MQWIKKQTSRFVWMFFLIIVLSVAHASAEEKSADPATEIQKPSQYLVVTYFHNTFRCPTCHKIEELSNETIHSYFADQLKSGKVVWRVINVDAPENKHFIQDYQLYSKHLIVSEIKDGKEVRWKDLKDIWTTVGDDEKFENYVKTEINDWLKG